MKNMQQDHNLKVHEIQNLKAHEKELVVEANKAREEADKAKEEVEKG
jgi:hypothetical protein